VWGCGGCGGWFPHAFEHSKVCTLCDFGHLQFLFSLKTCHLLLLCHLDEQELVCCHNNEDVVISFEN
jgi:hypothetical protein